MGIEMKNILVACGQGTCTSKMIAMKIEKYFKEKGVKDIAVSTCKIIEIKSHVERKKIDVVVTSSGTKNVLGFRSIVGTPLLSGINADQVYRQIEDALEELDEDRSER